jgi:hypothetical protein
MFGTFQQSHLRIEVNASSTAIRDSLTDARLLQQWLYPQTLSLSPAEHLAMGQTFTSQLGMITIQHQVDALDDTTLRLLMSQAVDGFHEWHWGDGWVQSSLAGISMLPLNLAQTMNLLRLRLFLEQRTAAEQSA